MPLLAIIIFIIVRHTSSIQIGVAAACLVVLGSMWGATANRETLQCAMPDRLTGTITRIYKLTDQQAQYIITASPNCLILVTTGRFPLFQEGNKVAVSGKTENVADMPEELAGYAQFLRQNKIVATVPFAELTLVGEREPSYLGIIRQSLRQHIVQTFAKPEAGVLLAMITGQRGSVAEDIEEQFRRTGLSHILAISGLHVSLLVGSVLILFYFFPLSPWMRTWVVIGLLWLYVFVIELRPSAVRAAIFWTAMLVALRLRVLISLSTVLLLALAVMVSSSPSILHDVGFQLSFSAVTGIGMVLFLARRLALQGFKPRWMKDLFLVSLGATLATWPLIAYHFGALSLISVPANVLAMPAVPFFLILGILVLLLSYMFSPLALLGSFSVHVLWMWIAFVVNTFSSMHTLYIENLVLSPWIISVYYAALIMVSMYIVARQGRSWREIWE